MKTYIILVLLMFFFVPASGQDIKTDDFKPIEFEDKFYTIPDSLANPILWKIIHENMPNIGVHPSIPTTSFILVNRVYAPQRLSVGSVDFKITPNISISNGQAWNYSPYPSGYLDARTIRMPMRR